MKTIIKFPENFPCKSVKEVKQIIEIMLQELAEEKIITQDLVDDNIVPNSDEVEIFSDGIYFALERLKKAIDDRREGSLSEEGR